MAQVIGKYTKKVIQLRKKDYFCSVNIEFFILYVLASLAMVDTIFNYLYIYGLTFLAKKVFFCCNIDSS